MNDEQKQLTIEGYNQRQLLVEQRRLEQAKTEAKIRANEEKERQHRIEKIKNGGGVLGDIIRISFLSCQAKLGSKYRSINPISLKLVDGEHKIVRLTSQKHKHRSYSKELTIEYQDGLVKINTGNSEIFLPYEPGWIKGQRYNNLSSKGSIRLKNCEISISAIPLSPYKFRMQKWRE